MNRLYTAKCRKMQGTSMDSAVEKKFGKTLLDAARRWPSGRRGAAKDHVLWFISAFFCFVRLTQLSRQGLAVFNRSAHSAGPSHKQ